MNQEIINEVRDKSSQDTPEQRLFQYDSIKKRIKGLEILLEAHEDMLRGIEESICENDCGVCEPDETDLEYYIPIWEELSKNPFNDIEVERLKKYINEIIVDVDPENDKRLIDFDLIRYYQNNKYSLYRMFSIDYERIMRLGK